MQSLHSKIILKIFSKLMSEVRMSLICQLKVYSASNYAQQEDRYVFVSQAFHRRDKISEVKEERLHSSN